MKKGLDTKKASFKLDLIETANVDPMIKPADFKLLAAYVAVMEWPSCHCELAMTLAMAKTGLSDRQIELSRARLLGKNEEGRAYLSPVRRRSNLARYMLVNPWHDEARERTLAMLGYHQAVERQRKSKKRALLSPENSSGDNNRLSPENSSGMSPENSSGKYPYEYPNKKRGREEGSQGSNVVPIDIKRRSAS